MIYDKIKNSKIVEFIDDVEFKTDKAQGYHKEIVNVKVGIHLNI